MQMLVVYAKDLKDGFADFAEPVSCTSCSTETISMSIRAHGLLSHLTYMHIHVHVVLLMLLLVHVYFLGG